MTVKRFSSRGGGSSNDGNEQFGAAEKESFINNSSEIRKDLVAGGGIEAIVNRLVSLWNLIDARNVFDEMLLQY